MRLAALRFAVLALLATLPACRCGEPPKPVPPPPTRLAGLPEHRLALLAYADDDGLVRALDPFSESLPTRLLLTDPGGKKRGETTPGRLRFALSHDGTRLAGAGGRGTLLVSAHDGSTQALLAGLRRSHEVAWSPDDAFLAETDALGQVRLFDVAQRSVVTTYDAETLETPDLSFALDGSRLAVSRAGRLLVWDVGDARPTAFGPDVGWGAAFLASADHLVTGTPEDGVQWLPLSGEPKIVAKSKGFVVAPDGRTFVVEGPNHAAVIVDGDTGEARPPLASTCRPLSAMAFSPDATRLAAASEDGSVRLWDAVSGAPLASWHVPVDCAPNATPWVVRLAFRRDGRELAFGWFDGAVELQPLPPPFAGGPRVAQPTPTPHPSNPAPRPLPAGSLVDRLETDRPGGYGTIAWSHTKPPVLAMAAGAGSESFDPASRTVSEAPPATEGEARFVAFVKGGLAHGRADGHVALAIAGVSRPVEAHPGGLTAMVASPDGTLLATGGRDRRVALWKVDGGELVSVFAKEALALAGGRSGELAQVSGLAFSPDGRWLFSTSDDHYEASNGEVWRFSTRDGSAQKVGDFSRSEAIAVSPDGRTLAVGRGPEVVLVDAAKGDTLATLVPESLENRAPPVRALAFSPDGALLAAGGEGVPHLRLWKLKDRSLERTLDDEQRCDTLWLAFSPDGALLAASTGCAVDLWSVR